eukprot:9289319-Lingulodinium_polyedra.AAC.1
MHHAVPARVAQNAEQSGGDAPDLSRSNGGASAFVNADKGTSRNEKTAHTLGAGAPCLLTP